MAHLRYLTIDKYAELSGYTPHAIRTKVDKGVWLEGRQFRRAPDGRIMIDIEGVEKWVEGQLEPSRPGRKASA